MTLKPVEIGTVVGAGNGLIDQRDVQPLFEAFARHVASRHARLAGPRVCGGAGGEDAGGDRPAAWLHPVCETLLSGPLEPGLDAAPDPTWRALEGPLAAAETMAPLPELALCRLWVQVCAGGSVDDVALAERLVALALEDAWPPVRALAYRMLAYGGWRRHLAALLRGLPAGGLHEADAWLEAELRPGERQPFLPLTPEPDPWVVGALATAWTRILELETALACPDGRVSPLAANEALDLVRRSGAVAERGYALRLWQRLRLRAISAFVRLRVGQWDGDDGILTTAPGAGLPAWEREYLRGLVAWVWRDEPGASDRLQRALALNPRQLVVRLALAALPMGPDAGVALAALADAPADDAVRVARAVALARTRNYDAAARELAGCSSPGPLEAGPLRFAWGRGRRQRELQRHALAAALAERRGDWKAAREAWRPAAVEARNPALVTGRDALRARWDPASAGPVAPESGAATPVTGGTALFFLGLCISRPDPPRARAIFRALLHRHGWLGREARVGGDRLRCLGDELLRLGEHTDAATAYRLAAEAGRDDARRLCDALVRGVAGPDGAADTKAPATGSGAEREAAIEHAWTVCAALVALTAGKPEVAARWLARVPRGGGGAAGHRGADVLVARAAGRECALATRDVEALPVAADVRAVLRLFVGEGDVAGRLRWYLDDVASGGVAPRGGADLAAFVADRTLALLDGAHVPEARQLVRQAVAAGVTDGAALAALVDGAAALGVAAGGRASDISAAWSMLRAHGRSSDTSRRVGGA